MVIPKINSAHGSDTRNIINAAIDSINVQGKSIQDLVAKGQLTPSQYVSLIRAVNGLISKGDVSVDDIDLNKGKISLYHLDDDVKQAMTGVTPILSEVADRSVTVSKIYNGAVTPDKTNFISVRNLNLFNKDDSENKSGILTPTGVVANANYFHSHYIPIEPGKTYSRSAKETTLIFNENKEYIRGISASSPDTFVVGEGEKFAVIHATVAAKDVTMLSEGVLPDTYSPFNTLDVESDVITKLITSELEHSNNGESEQNIVDWVVVGDSLTEVNIRSTKFYHDYISEDLGWSVTNLGKSGTGYKITDEKGNAFYQRILDMPVNIDVVTIFGSLNDISSAAPLGTPSDVGVETIAGAINKTIDNLYSINPTVPLGIISPTPWQSSIPADESNQHTKYVRLLETICKNRGIPFLNLYFSSGLRPWDTQYRSLMYSRDDGNGVHPDEKGHKLIAPKIREFVKTLI